MDANREARSIQWATRCHGHGKNVARRVMVGNKSRAGGVLRRNHFTQTEPNMSGIHTPGELKGTTRYAVKRGKKVIMVCTMRSQAESIAHAKCGYVSIL